MKYYDKAALIRKLLIVALFAIALAVFIGKLAGADMWIPIALYWAVLAAKNYIDWRGV